MIVCVLLVSKSRGYCLTAPGYHEGIARVIAPRRDNTRGSLTPTIQTQPYLIPIITWCHNFFHSNQYYAHKKQFKTWTESNSSLRCHDTTLSRWQVSESPPPPVAKMRVLVFAGDWACEIELRQTLPNENDKFYTTMIYLCFSRSVCFFDGIACLMKVWPLFKREFPRVPMTWRSARARANFKCDVVDVNKYFRTDFRGVKCVSGECYQPCR